MSIYNFEWQQLITSNLLFFWPPAHAHIDKKINFKTALNYLVTNNLLFGVEVIQKKFFYLLINTVRSWSILQIQLFLQIR